MLTAPILPLAPSTPPVANPAAPTVSGPGFAESLASVLGDVNSTAAQANVAVGRMLDGTGDVHEAMIALQDRIEAGQRFVIPSAPRREAAQVLVPIAQVA